MLRRLLRRLVVSRVCCVCALRRVCVASCLCSVVFVLRRMCVLRSVCVAWCVGCCGVRRVDWRWLTLAV